MLDRVERAQAGIGTIARNQNHLDPRLTKGAIEAEEFLHQWKGIAGAENFLLVLDLILAIRLDTFGLVDPMTVTQVKQGPRGNRQNQFVAQSIAHTRS